MERFRNLIIREKVIKVPNQMEALRIFNYPYQAIEEAVVNAFYHRDYMFYEPVTIEIEHDCINIMNFPGIDRSISEKTIAEGKRFVSRYYRNRRLGEFKKNLIYLKVILQVSRRYRKNLKRMDRQEQSSLWMKIEEL